ncbi:unnamed protein product [Phaedon cochleariae]|uniref:Nuclear-export cofactor Arc1-like N-terminal domain-containing protein n=1 Tax=Phaedon cochleariae TaxID=80249 RepID=A0A9N9S8U0_PHACE|nr:unnamed protein product [Phaedon cochleariae]
MVTAVEQHLKPIASFLKVKLKTNAKDGKSPGNGVISTIFKLLEDSKSNLGPSNTGESAEIQQWIEYGLLYLSKTQGSNLNFILCELNGFLSTRTYFVAHRFTIADAFLFYKLHTVLESLATLEKERYLNVCRWFDNLQGDNTLRQNRTLINFSTNYLGRSSCRGPI